MLEHEAKRRGVQIHTLLKPEFYEPILKRYAFQELDDIYGRGGLRRHGLVVRSSAV